ncbi:MlaD family protein [Flavobacteriales bacterium]|jgi:phospholipid/cholesterol/gamma-HCH transport system substrate-binding protein|nr:MlaD family protein [Flavobacteriales bacterium]MDB2622656.1 MlaD family protein [Flavobacteriales bacterium]
MKYSKELAIGLTTVATIICFTWGYNFLKGKNVFKAKRDYYAFYDHVHGLEVGQPVTISGYKIGQVTEITFDASYGGALLVGFHISKPLDISNDTKVKIYDMDIMGAKGLQLEPGISKVMAISGDTLQGDIQISLTEQVTKQFVPIKDGTERLINVLDSTLRSITLLTQKASDLIEVNHNSISSAAEHIDTLSQTLNAQREDFEVILNNFRTFSSDLAASNVSSAISQIDETMNSLDLVLTDINTGHGSLGKLVKDGQLYTDMTASMSQLELLLEDLREHPKRYVHFSLFGRKESTAPSDTLN